MGYLAYALLTRACARIPFGIQYWMARRFSDLAYLLSSRSRFGVHSNLRVILGEQTDSRELKRRTRATFRSFGRYLCEFFGTAGWDQTFFDRQVRVVGRENLDHALAKGRGMLFVSGHYSNWELGAFAVGRLGYPILIVAQIHDDPRVNELFVRARALHGVEVAPTAKGARSALRALRDNRPVAILGDRPTGGPTVEVRLCGQPTGFPQGPWRLALDTGAPLLPTFMRRDPDGTYTLFIGEPIPVPGDGSREDRMNSLAQSFADALEERLREDPTQWAAFYPVWTTSAALHPTTDRALHGHPRPAEVRS